MEKQKLQIVKIGGNVINDEHALNSFLKNFSTLKEPKILVHGGGKRASEISSAMGLVSKMVNGRRVTNAETLEVVTMVYAGLLNKNITAKLQQFNCNAMGLTGADANVIIAHKRDINDVDYGFVGDIDKINPEMISLLLENKITPVFCAITHNKKGQLLNTNADTIAAEIAIGMSKLFETEINYVFELQGVLKNIEDENSIIEKINLKKYKQLVDEGIIANGMLPKLQNCFNALENGVGKVKIGDASLINSTTTKYTTLSLK
ncbi:acetylglutamate kinase [uncultured Lutibacter sp.]|uniref:acetylglutamate kinase n=1 Tax=uncultured Lutibacter sp. TaxID=437739 RepID=UPI0026279543|nr:acetylglutamate kinase [uncultured Lutibacter sp.]